MLWPYPTFLIGLTLYWNSSVRLDFHSYPIMSCTSSLWLTASCFYKRSKTHSHLKLSFEFGWGFDLVEVWIFELSYQQWTKLKSLQAIESSYLNHTLLSKPCTYPTLDIMDNPQVPKLSGNVSCCPMCSAHFVPFSFSAELSLFFLLSSISELNATILHHIT